MKKRWIEITRFRRRSIIVSRDSSASGIAADPGPDAEALVRSDAVPFMKIDLDQLEATDSAAPHSFRSNKGRTAKDRKPT